MNEFLKIPIRKNKTNNQLNLHPRRRDLPKNIKNKFDASKFLKIKWEDIDFE